MKRAAFVVVGSLALGCGDDLRLGHDAAPPATSSSVVGAGGAGGGGGGAPSAGGAPAKAKRTIATRSPFGNAAAGNLLADGDFELTGRQGQMAWFSYGKSGGETVDYRTGGACRSGVRCAYLVADGRDLVGFLASPKTGGVEVSLWTKPSSGVCTDLLLSFVDLETNMVGADVALASDAPDEDGWCHFAGAGPNYAGRVPALYLRFSDGAKGDAVVDDGVVTAAKARHEGLVAAVTTPRDAARLRAIGEALRRRVPAPIVEPTR